MTKVKNKGIIRMLSKKSYRQNLRRNMTAVLAIALTTLLFTSLFTIGMGIVSSLEYNSMRMSGGKSHGSYKYVNSEQIDAIENHPLIDEVGRSRFCGIVNTGKLLKRPIELNSKDKTELRLSFLELAGGSMPEKANDIVLDTVSLQMLGLEEKTGQTAVLDVDIGTEIKSIDFNICGWYVGDPAFSASNALVSEAFWETYLTGRGQNFNADGDTYGSMNANIMLKSSANIENDLIQILEDSGFSIDETQDNYVPYGVNWAYMSTATTGNFGAVGAIGGGLALIMFTGYLIIYNIFQISVTKDVRFYGLLKTIGTTGRQIRRILVLQALRMCIVGIPLGLATGFGVGALLLPLITSQLYGGQTNVSFSPVIFIGATLFSVITVLISCGKPAKTAAKISPVEAVRYSGVDNLGKRKNKKSTDGAKLFRMALSNLGRNKKRTVIAIISMSLSLVLMNTVFGISTCLDLDKFVSDFIDCDYQLAHASYFNLQYSVSEEENPVSDSFINAFEAMEGFEEGGAVYTDYSLEMYTDFEGDVVKTYGTYHFTPEYKMPTTIYGMDDFALDQMNIFKGKYDKEKFASGDYVMIGLLNEEDYEAYFDVGEKITLYEKTNSYKNPEFDHYDEQTGQYINKNGEPMDLSDLDIMEYNGKKKEYTVMGYYELTSNNTCRGYGDMPTFALPTKEFREWTDTPKAMTYIANVKEGYENSFDDFVKQYTQSTEPTMDYESRESFTKEFEQMKMMILTIGGALCAIIGFIGLLNFVNSISTGIISRENEFAMLRSIGMTRKQLQRMLCCEGLYYALFTSLISLTLGEVCSLIIIKLTCSMLRFMTYSFVIMPLVIAVPVLLVFGAAVPLIAFGTSDKQSIVERLRETE